MQEIVWTVGAFAEWVKDRDSDKLYFHPLDITAIGGGAIFILLLINLLM